MYVAVSWGGRREREEEQKTLWESAHHSDRKFGLTGVIPTAARLAMGNKQMPPGPDTGNVEGIVRGRGRHSKAFSEPYKGPAEDRSQRPWDQALLRLNTFASSPIR